uniref:Uncharacterized protein n=1 Tax=Glossina pallidipes TaxID=7398 RepID=A0A1A9ZFV7_GLOPL
MMLPIEDLLFTRSSDLSRDRELEQLILGEDVLPASADVGIAVSSNSVIAITVMASVDITVFHCLHYSCKGIFSYLTFFKFLPSVSFNSFMPLAVNQLASMAIELLWPYH